MCSEHTHAVPRSRQNLRHAAEPAAGDDNGKDRRAPPQSNGDVHRERRRAAAPSARIRRRCATAGAGQAHRTGDRPSDRRRFPTLRSSF
jgi:hypothetical protein